MLKRRSSGKKTLDLLLFVDTIMDGCNFKFLMTVVTVCSVECGVAECSTNDYWLDFLTPLIFMYFLTSENLHFCRMASAGSTISYRACLTSRLGKPSR